MNKWNAKDLSVDKAGKSIEETLWQSCDKLRGLVEKQLLQEEKESQEELKATFKTLGYEI